MKNKKSSLNKKAFTLVEMLVVVLITGILVAIAVPQYQKVVLKANLHKGVSLVNSLYEAQQVYYLTNNSFSKDIGELDLSTPTNSSCTYSKNSSQHKYVCDYGTIWLADNFSEIGYIEPSNRVSYWYFFKDLNYNGLLFKKDKRYCMAKINNNLGNSVCKEMGGTYIGTSYWDYYIMN